MARKGLSHKVADKGPSTKKENKKDKKADQFAETLFIRLPNFKHQGGTKKEEGKEPAPIRPIRF